MSEPQLPSIAHLPKPALAPRAVFAVALLTSFYLFSICVSCIIFAIPILYILGSERINFWAVIVLFVGCWGTAGSLIVNLITYRPRPFFPKGRRVEEAEAPELADFLQALAAATSTTPIEEVYLTEGASLAVHEIGGLFGRPLRRILVLGAPLVAALSVHELRAGVAQQVAFYSFGSARALRVIRYCSNALSTLADGPKAEQFNELNYSRPLETSIGFAKDLTHFLTICTVAMFDNIAEFFNSALTTAADRAAGVIAGEKATVRFLKRASAVHRLVEPYRERITYVSRWA
jgi:hypothetical protein